MCCKAIVPKTVVIVIIAMIKVNCSDRFYCNDQSHCNKTYEVFDCKVIETGLQVSSDEDLFFIENGCFWFKKALQIR